MRIYSHTMRIAPLCLPLFAFIPLALAGWPPRQCTPGTMIQGADVILTSDVQHDNACTHSDRYANVAYIKISRSYGIPTNDNTDSKMSIQIQTGRDTFDLTIYNDEINFHEESCTVLTASDSPNEFFWLRVRMSPLRELRKTFFSLSIAESGSSNFVDCAKFEHGTVLNQFKMSFKAKTNSNMIQTVHQVTTQRPNIEVGAATNVLEMRIERLEERLRRVQSTLTEYMQSHDTLVEQSEARHTSLKSSVSEAHNRIVHRTNAHGMVYIFLFVMIMICGCAYVRWKRKEERRMHLF